MSMEGIALTGQKANSGLAVFGVAKGYRGDSALTGQKFITDQYGRWYRTGDLGRIWDDEIIEFLGEKTIR